MAAFEEVVARHHDGVRHVVARYLGGSGDAEDLVQEVFVEAHHGLHGLAEPDRLGPWLRGIARHRCLTHLRRRHRTMSYDEVGGDGTVDVRIHESWAHEHRVRTPEEELEASQDTALLAQAVSRLSQTNREVVRRHYLESEPYEVIADSLQVPVSTIEGRLYRARRALREEILSMAQADIDREALEDVIHRATAGLEEEVKSLKEQVQVLTIEDRYLQDARAAAIPQITRLPVHAKRPLTWGVIGAFRLGPGNRSARVSVTSTDDIDTFLSKVDDEELATFVALFTDRRVLNVLRALVASQWLDDGDLERLGLSGPDGEEVLRRMQEARMVTRLEDGRVGGRGREADGTTYLLTLISLATIALGRTESDEEAEA